MSDDVKTFRDTRTVSLVSALVEGGLVTPTRRNEAIDVVDRVLGDQSTGATPLRKSLAELAGYIGGAFVVSAAGVFFAVQWDKMNSGQQIGLLCGIAALLAAAGFAVAAASGAGISAVRGGEEPVRRRLSGSLFTGAAASFAGAVGLLAHDSLARTETTAALLGFTALALVSLLGYLIAPSVVGQLGVATGTVSALLFFTDRADLSALGSGLVIVGVGVLWLIASERGLWREVASARVIGSALAILGAQMSVFDFEERWFGYLTLAIVAAAAFGVYLVRPAWPYLAAGVIAMTLVIPEAVLDWTDNALGPAGALLIAGMTLLVASLLGFRLRKEVTEV